jgi:heme/copper-type cytochrome/quinol oxidase subunit 3
LVEEAYLLLMAEGPPEKGMVSRRDDEPPFWPPPAGWQPGADVPRFTKRRIGRVELYVRGTLSTLALLSGGFLVVLGVAAAAQKQHGSGAAAAGVISILFGLPLLVLGIVGWRGLRRRRRSAS